MKVVEPYHSILSPSTYADWERECKLIELAGRTAYKSEDKITKNSYKDFIERIVQRNHGAVLEFGTMMVYFYTDRGVTHELVRHRLCSFLQESTRYCNYSQDKFGNEVTFINREFHNYGDEQAWRLACCQAEQSYLDMLAAGSSPQEARSVLPNSLKTEIVVRANFREWRHIFQLRAISKAAHPDMRNLMIPLYDTCRGVCPEVFEMGDPE